ncbi:hypothetical protein ACFQE0_01805 [Methylobacterium komagatae]|uniref:Uncharacterized protein n=1 Tax=Methylobacterium komagatae TaxID=374425 RepID=A0ABW2BDR8_9HYPH
MVLTAHRLGLDAERTVSLFREDVFARLGYLDRWEPAVRELSAAAEQAGFSLDRELDALGAARRLHAPDEPPEGVRDGRHRQANVARGGHRTRASRGRGLPRRRTHPRCGLADLSAGRRAIRTAGILPVQGEGAGRVFPGPLRSAGLRRGELCAL